MAEKALFQCWLLSVGIRGGWKTPWTGQFAHVKMSLSWTVYDVELCISTELWYPLLYPHSSAYNYSSVFVCCSTLIKSPQWVMHWGNWPAIYAWLHNWMNTICLQNECFVQLIFYFLFFYSAMFKKNAGLESWKRLRHICCCRLGTSVSTLCTPCHVPKRLAFLLSSINILLLMSSSRSWFDRNFCHFFSPQSMLVSGCFFLFVQMKPICRKFLQ